MAEGKNKTTEVAYTEGVESCQSATSKDEHIGCGKTGRFEFKVQRYNGKG